MPPTRDIGGKKKSTALSRQLCIFSRWKGSKCWDLAAYEDIRLKSCEIGIPCLERKVREKRRQQGTVMAAAVLLNRKLRGKKNWFGSLTGWSVQRTFLPLCLAQLHGSMIVRTEQNSIEMGGDEEILLNKKSIWTKVNQPRFEQNYMDWLAIEQSKM